MDNSKAVNQGLSDEQVDLLQAFIDSSMSGVYEAMTIIPEDFREYFATPTLHGQHFKLAVEQRRLTKIVLSHFDMGSKHYWYMIE